MDIYDRVKGYIASHGLLDDAVSVLAAVSGGADSVCMLLLLKRYADESGIRLGVVHVDHGFREEAAEEASYVEKLCRERDISFFLEKIEPGSIRASEEEARIKRYELIEEVAAKNRFDVIALAHNANDRAETMLFNLFRGSGISGLASIRPKRDRFIRPVMCLERAVIEEYLDGSGIRYCTDKTNNEDLYSRNRIRHHILPEAVNINPEAVEHMNAASDALDEIYGFIKEEAQHAYIRCRQTFIPDDAGYVSATVGQPQNGPVNVTAQILDIEDLSALHPVIRSEVIRLAILDMTPHLKDITREHIALIESLIGAKNGAEVHLPYGIRAYREYKNIYIESDFAQSSVTESLSVDITHISSDAPVKVIFGTYEITFSVTDITGDTDLSEYKRAYKYTKSFDYDKIKPLLTVKSAEDTDRIVIDSQSHTKQLNRIFIDEKIPRRLRDSIPVIADEDGVLWVTGVRECTDRRITGDTRRILTVKAVNPA